MTGSDREVPHIYCSVGALKREAVARLGEEIEVRAVTSIREVKPEDDPTVLLLDDALAIASDAKGALAALPGQVVVVTLDARSREVAGEAGREFLSLLGAPPGEGEMVLIRAALTHAVALAGMVRAERMLSRRHLELRELNQVGMALMSERDPDSLLDLILTQARRLTSSDAGSLYLVEEGKDGAGLRFRLAHNDSIPGLPAPDFLLPIDEKSIAGYVANTGEPLVIEDAYDLPAGVPYTFNRGFDEDFGYRAKSMLAVPMKDHRDRTVGVLQLLNRKARTEGRIRTEEDALREVLPYSEHEVDLVQSLAGQAAVSIENGLLYRSIENLFEGFIKAAVTAIDQRDPTTSGHSVRVATLTCDLAEAADRTSSGVFRDTSFSREQMKELRYAGLLHDFGKVGVREQVLVKSKKLPPVMLERIEARFDLIRRTIEAEFFKRKAELIQKAGPDRWESEATAYLREYEEALERVDRFQEAVREANEPRVLPEEAGSILQEIARTRFPGVRGEEVPYITPDELHFLSIPKGSLDPEERRQIESHVSLTYQFLQQIPWTEDLSRVAEIAHGHHEKIDGTGYPRGVSGQEIPLQTRMMTVADIFDALTASDRPYKKALPPERAIAILDMEAKGGQLDAEVVRLLVESEVYHRILDEDWRGF